MVLGRSRFGNAELGSHRPTLAIAKKTLDEYHFKTTQKTTDRTSPSFKIGDRVYFKNKHPSKWDLKWRPGYRIVQIECDRHFLHIENQAIGKVQSCNVKDVVLEPHAEFWNIDTQFSRAVKFINHLQTYLPYIFMINWYHHSCIQHCK